MGIILAVKKKDKVCIASDSMVISGAGRKNSFEHIAHPEKVIKWDDSYIGIAGHPSWLNIIRDYIAKRRKKALLQNPDQIFKELLQLHKTLKEEYCLNTGTDAESAFESSGLTSIIVNRKGIFKTYEYRSIQEFNQYTAIGSASQYALGALYTLYDRYSTAEDITKAALETAVTFDDSSSLPGFFYTIKLK